MPHATESSPSIDSESVEPEQPDPSERLAGLLAGCLAYARKTQLQGFRYCRHPRNAPAPFRDLEAGLELLESCLSDLSAKRPCQSSAFSLLSDLARLRHCRDGRSLKISALIDRALLQLR